MLYVILFEGEPPFVDDAPQDGAASVPLDLDERAAKAVRALMDLESFEISHALAAIYLAGVSRSSS